jgi:hypothetical protein
MCHCVDDNNIMHTTQIVLTRSTPRANYANTLSFLSYAHNNSSSNDITVSVINLDDLFADVICVPDKRTDADPAVVPNRGGIPTMTTTTTTKTTVVESEARSILLANNSAQQKRQDEEQRKQRQYHRRQQKQMLQSQSQPRQPQQQQQSRPMTQQQQQQQHAVTHTHTIRVNSMQQQPSAPPRWISRPPYPFFSPAPNNNNKAQQQQQQQHNNNQGKKQQEVRKMGGEREMDKTEK